MTPGAVQQLPYASTIGEHSHRLAPRQIRGICALLFIGIGLFFWLDASGHAWLPISDGPDVWANPLPDFEYFYRSGQWLLNRGGLDQGYDVLPGGQIKYRGMLDWYLPFVPRLMTVIAWLPSWLAGCIWVAINITAMFAVVRLIGRRMMGLPVEDWPVTQILPFIFLIAYWSTEFKLNQINVLTLLLLVAGFVQWQDGRKRLSGFWLGLATLIKLTPALVILWFLLKREFRTVGFAVLTIVLAGPVSDLIVFGPQDTYDGYRAWVRNAIHSASHRGLILEQREMDWRNQGMGAVIARWLHPTSWATKFDNEPRAAGRAAEPQFINVADVPLEAVALIANGVVAASLLALIILARKPAAALDPWQLRFEWSLCVLGMLWFMPVMRQYHMIWAMPAMSMLAAGVAHFRSRRWTGLALVSYACVIAAQICLISKPLKAMGVSLASVAILAFPMIWFLVRRPHSQTPTTATLAPAV